ncbi:MAG: class II fumarate hydratase [Mycoplasmataceae bacterium]|nr:class II fumarate hydratase [Mycoplasmataceae bacterium]
MAKNTKKIRVERDSIGVMEVPVDKYWGAQTQRSLTNFNIGTEIVSLRLIYAVAATKWAAASANEKCKKLDKTRAGLIRQACEEILASKLDENFPTHAYQAGSGTQTNMNVNEVIAHRANEIARKNLVHPNDHCNMSQSTNDVYPTAMNITAIDLTRNLLLPAVNRLITACEKLQERAQNVLKMGRTHIQDALPITFGQEVSGWVYALKNGKHMLQDALKYMFEVNMGGTAVGTGYSAPKHYDVYCVEFLNKILKSHEFKVTANKYHGTWSKDNFVYLHGAVKALAVNIYKIAQDVRFLASGPRSGFGEITIPANEPGSSIMPGKVNPTQCEGMAMICGQVMGHDTTIAFLASQGNFELNTFGTVLMQNFIQSITLFSEMIDSFDKRCVSGIVINHDRMDHYVRNSLMLVTALADHIGYEKSSEIAKYAYQHKTTLKKAALLLKYVSEAEFDKVVDPKKMV